MYKDRIPSLHQLSSSSVTSYQTKPLESSPSLQHSVKDQTEKYSYNHRASLKIEPNSDLAFLRNTVGPISTIDHNYLCVNDSKKIDTSLRQTMNVTSDLKDILRVQGSLTDKRNIKTETLISREKETKNHPIQPKKDDRLSKIMDKYQKKNQTKEALKLLEQLKQLKKKQEQLKKQRKNDPPQPMQNSKKITGSGFEVNSPLNFSKKNKVDYYTPTYQNKSLSTNASSPQNENYLNIRENKQSYQLNRDDKKMDKEDFSISINNQPFQKIGPVDPLIPVISLSKNPHPTKSTTNLRPHYEQSNDLTLSKSLFRQQKNDYLSSPTLAQSKYDKEKKNLSPYKPSNTYSTTNPSTSSVTTKDNSSFSKSPNHKYQQNPSFPSNKVSSSNLKSSYHQTHPQLNLYSSFSSNSSLNSSKHFKDEFINKRLSINDFIIQKNLGEGKFGTVFQVFDKRTKSIYALKKIPKSVIKSHWMIDQFILEVKIQNFCDHPNILTLHGVFDDTDHVYILLEYMQQGTLFLHLKKNSTLDEKQAAIKIKQIASAIKYLHENGIAHRDLKPENIVMSHGVCKLCDFGWATICDERRKTYCGTFDYAAPEILEGEEYDMSVDLWCLGILTYEILVGKAPFYHISRKETMKKIMNKITYPSSMSYEARSFIDQLLKKNPEERLKSEDLLKHPFILLADK